MPTTQPGMREALVDHATRVVEAGGQGSLTARALAAAAGTSTMVVYTHFDGMTDVLDAVRGQGFARISAAWAAVERTTDPVADLGMAGGAYVAFALGSPHLYRTMFAGEPGFERTVPHELAAAPIGLLDACISAGRFEPADPLDLAWQLWAATHGVASGLLAGVIPAADGPRRLAQMARTLYIGFGDAPAVAERSIRRTRRRLSA